MKIFLLGFFVMALSSVNEAGQSDNGKDKGQEKETNKSQLDMLARLKQQEDHIQQLQEESAHQRLRTKEQELKNEELQVQLQDQQLQLKELKKINRQKRSDNETDEHLKELIRAEINPLIAGLSSCEVGTFWYTPGVDEVMRTNTIYFKRNFTRTPKVVTSCYGHYRDPDGYIKSDWGFNVAAVSPTTTKFDLRYHARGFYNFYASWIACA